MVLHKKKIFSEVEDRHVWKTTADAGDNWRIMCKHIYNIVKDMIFIPDIYPKVKQMASLIKLPASDHADGIPPQVASNSETDGIPHQVTMNVRSCIHVS